ncbi:MAG: DUF928 domain-containing protein [Symploca sp. SIO2C1]|nr:DUF928 domain-containing protein [Symploca sp. SIO2C1]
MLKLPATLIIALVLLVDISSSLKLVQEGRREENLYSKIFNPFSRFGYFHQAAPVLAQDSNLNTQVDNRKPLPEQGKPTGTDIAGTQVRQPPPDGAMPTGREPAGTRGPCFQGDTDFIIPFTPLLPVIDYEFAGLTLTEHPTFWFYIPYPTNRVSLGKFSLEDEQKNSIYETHLELAKTPGFISVSLPTTAKPLKNNQQYKWTFMLYGGSDESYVFHQGLVQKVDITSLKSQLSTTTLKERITFYERNRIWYDAATDLPQIHSIPEAWAALLRVIGLEQLEQEPLVGSALSIEESEFDARIGREQECEISVQDR